MNFIILCGGSGSRLWPVSREKLPKQFLRLTNEYTMLQNTILRIIELNNKLKELYLASSSFSTDINNIDNIKLNKIFVICNIDHSHIVEKQCNEMDLDISIKIITEPKGRDSAPAICISSLLGDLNDNTFIIPCDHIFDNEEFIKCSIESLKFIENSIITFGIKPTKPETGYGYIQIGVNNKTERFIEKPNLELAEKYFKSGDFLWNAGIFIFKNKNMIDCFLKYSIDILTNCTETLKNTDFTKEIINLSSNPFVNCKSISIDYAIMEHIVFNNDGLLSAITIPYNSFWNDIGSYSALYNELDKDENNNVIRGNIFTMDTTNSYIETEDNFTSVIGMNNLIVVNTRDALLICDNNKTQDVKKVVEHLKKNNMEEAFFHKKVFRPWGYYINIEGHDYSGFKVKRIAVYPGKRLSLQSHNKRSEHWVIVKGNAKVQIDTKFILLNKDDYIYIPVLTLHRIENIGTELLEFTETQIGEYLGEDDIIRYEDDFGRVA